MDKEALEAEVLKLREQVDYWRNKAVTNWDIVETVSCGEKLQCAACGQYHPCLCDK